MSISSVVKSIQDIMRKDAGVDGDAQLLVPALMVIVFKKFDAEEENLDFQRNPSLL